MITTLAWESTSPASVGGRQKGNSSGFSASRCWSTTHRSFTFPFRALMKGMKAPTIATRSVGWTPAASSASIPGSNRPPGVPKRSIARAERPFSTATPTARRRGWGAKAYSASAQASCPASRPEGGAAAADRGQQTVSVSPRGVKATPTWPVSSLAAV